MACHDIASIKQVVELELHIPGALAVVGHGIDRGVARQGDRVAGIGETGSDIVQTTAKAEAIAQSAGPFGNFTDKMRRGADQIVVVSRFRFTRDEVLEARLTER